MKLSELKPGAGGVIREFTGGTDLAAIRMMEMGLTIGSPVTVEHEAPFGGAIAVRCRGSLIALRLSDAALIEVTT